MKVLVVGGAGYIGGGVTDLLMKSKHTLRVYDSLIYEQSYRKPIDFVYGDIRDTKLLKKHLNWADAVIWLAALVGDGACAINPEISMELNSESVKWLANNFKGKIIFMSTCSVYGAQDQELDENSPVKPLSVYAVSKIVAEQYLKNKNSIIFRLGTVFGLSDTYSRIRLDLVVNTMTARAHKEGKLSVFGGEQYRPLLHVRDIAQAAVENLTSKKTGVYNLNKKNYKIVDLAKEVKRHFPKVKLEITDMKFEDLRNYRVNCNKATKELGFKPKLDVADGVKELKKLLEENRIKDINNPVYTNQKYLAMFNVHKEIANGGCK